MDGNFNNVLSVLGALARNTGFNTISNVKADPDYSFMIGNKTYSSDNTECKWWEGTFQLVSDIHELAKDSEVSNLEVTAKVLAEKLLNSDFKIEDLYSNSKELNNPLIGFNVLMFTLLLWSYNSPVATHCLIGDHKITTTEELRRLISDLTSAKIYPERALKRIYTALQEGGAAYDNIIDAYNKGLERPCLLLTNMILHRMVLFHQFPEKDRALMVYVSTMNFFGLRLQLREGMTYEFMEEDLDCFFKVNKHGQICSVARPSGYIPIHKLFDISQAPNFPRKDLEWFASNMIDHTVEKRFDRKTTIISNHLLLTYLPSHVKHALPFFLPEVD